MGYLDVENIPCVDCITLSICKAEYDMDSTCANWWFITRSNLQEKCELLHQHFGSKIYLDDPQNTKVYEFHNFFKGLSDG